MRAQNLIDTAQRHAEQTPDAIAYAFLRNGETLAEKLSFAELDTRARALAATLQELARPGDRALLIYEPGLDFVTAFLGCQYAGVVAVPTAPPRLDRIETTASRMSTIASDAQPAVVLTTRELVPPLERSTRGRIGRPIWQATDCLDLARAALWRREHIDGSALSFLQYTSGSTSMPKGVMVSHENLMANLKMLRETANLDGRYNFVSWLPLFHDMGLIGVVLHGLYVGGETRLMSPLSFLKRPIRWLQAITRHERVFSGGPNFAFELCLARISEADKSSLDLREWRVAFSGAETVRAQTLERFQHAFSGCGLRTEALLPCYGLAEATLVVSARTPGRSYRSLDLDAAALERGEAQGAAARGTPSTVVSCGSTKGEQVIAIVDPHTCNRRRDRTVGEVWVRGPNIALGYFGQPERSTETFCAKTSAGEGPFMRTGDLGFLDDGELYITGRIKELIVVRGRCLYPQDIELLVDSMADRFPAIRPGNCAAFALSGPEQEGVGLIVQVRTEHPAGFAHERLVEALQERLLAELEVGFNEVLLVKSAIPKTSSGKKMRLACSHMLASNDPDLMVVYRWRRAAIEEIPSVPHASPDGSEPSHARFRRIVDLVTGWIAREAQTDPRNIRPDQSLVDFGLDSLGAVSLVEFLEERLDLAIPTSQLREHRTIAEFARALSKTGCWKQ